MRSRSLVFLLAIFAVVFLFQLGQAAVQRDAPAAKTAEEQVRALDLQLMDAVFRNDWRSLERLFANNYESIHGDGAIGARKEELEAFQSGVVKFDAYEPRELKVRVYGEEAVTTSLYSVKATRNGKLHQGDIRAARVWIRKSEGWKLVAHQATRVPLLSPPAEARWPASIPKVGFIYPGSKNLSPMFESFRQGLASLGYVEGRNVAIEARFADGHYERVSELASELAHLRVDVLAVQGAVTVRLARKVVTAIPIVFAIVVDPVDEDVVANLERPGGNVTGVTIFDPEQPRKQIQLLKEVFRGIRRVAFLGDEGIRENQMKAKEEQAQALGLETQRVRLSPSPDLNAAFAAFRQQHAQAVIVLEEPVPMNHRKMIAELAATDRLPTIFPASGADAGGLIAYGPSFREGYRRMAEHVVRILKGARPGELPVQTVNRYELVVNLKTARQIGVNVPPEVVKRADRVID